MSLPAVFMAFGIGVVILIILSLFVIFNFYRYRFEGDRTGLIIISFIIGFALLLSFTLFTAQLVQPTLINVEPIF